MGLLTVCWSQVTDWQLQRISEAPYSENDLTLQRLRAFRDSAPSWSTSDWGYAPCEALGLFRWTTLNEAYGTTTVDPILREQHGMRLTCCTTLAYVHDRDLPSDHSPGHTALLLAHSAMNLGPNASNLAFELAVWLLSKCMRKSPTLASLHTALALFCLGARTGRLSADNLRVLLNWLEHWEAEQATRETQTGKWLFRLADWHPTKDCLVHLPVMLSAHGLGAAVQAQVDRLRSHLT